MLVPGNRLEVLKLERLASFGARPKSHETAGRTARRTARPVIPTPLCHHKSGRA